MCNSSLACVVLKNSWPSNCILVDLVWEKKLLKCHAKIPFCQKPDRLQCIWRVGFTKNTMKKMQISPCEWLGHQFLFSILIGCGNFGKNWAHGIWLHTTLQYFKSSLDLPYWTCDNIAYSDLNHLAQIWIFAHPYNLHRFESLHSHTTMMTMTIIKNWA